MNAITDLDLIVSETTTESSTDSIGDAGIGNTLKSFKVFGKKISQFMKRSLKALV